MSNYTSLRDKHLESIPAAILVLDSGDKVFLKRGYDATLLGEITGVNDKYPTYIFYNSNPKEVIDAFIEEYSV